jgi:hypothetical protein
MTTLAIVPAPEALSNITCFKDILIFLLERNGKEQGRSR